MTIEGNSESINRYTLQCQYMFARGEMKNAYLHIYQLIETFKASPYLGRLKGTLGILLLNEDRIYEAENYLKEAEEICKTNNDNYG